MRISDWSSDVCSSDLRDIKNHTLANLDFYLERYEEKVIASGGQVHWAPTAEDAVKAVLDICRRVDARVVTKGKSMISRSEEHTSELQSLMRISYAVFCLKKKKKKNK